MVTENLQQIKVSVSSLVIRNGIYQAILEYYDENGKRQQPWRSTGLKERGNKKQAMAKAEEIRMNLENQLNLMIIIIVYLLLNVKYYVLILASILL